MEIRASIAMAVYNGEKYIAEQLESIINMLGETDEIVISYDESTDDTYEIIKKYQNNDTRIRVIKNTIRGLESNFNNAVMNCEGKYIFLADQDDVWINDKVNVMVRYMEENPQIKVLISNGYFTDANLNKQETIFEHYKTTASPIKNFIKGTYLGCQMAFDSSIRDYVWPVRVTPPLPHDLWLGVVGGGYGETALLDEKLILHRIHSENYTHTSKMKLLGVIKNRWLFLTEIIKVRKKNRKLK